MPLNYAGLIPCKGIRRQPAGTTIYLSVFCLFVQVFGLVKNGSSLSFDIHSHHFLTSEFCQRGATVDTLFLTALKTWAVLMVYLVVKGVQGKGSNSSVMRESNPNFVPLLDQNNVDQKILDLKILSFKMF